MHKITNFNKSRIYRQVCHEKSKQKENFDQHFQIIGKSIKVDKVDKVDEFILNSSRNNSQNTGLKVMKRNTDKKLPKIQIKIESNKFVVDKEVSTSFSHPKVGLSQKGTKSLQKIQRKIFVNKQIDEWKEQKIIDKITKNEKQFAQDQFQKTNISIDNSVHFSYEHLSPSRSHESALNLKDPSQKNPKNQTIIQSKDFQISIKTITCHQGSILQSIQHPTSIKQVDIIQELKENKQQQQQFQGWNYQQSNPNEYQHFSETYLAILNSKDKEYKIRNLEKMNEPILVKLLNNTLQMKQLDIFCINFSWFRRMKELRLHQLKEFLYLHPKDNQDIFPYINRYECILESYQVQYIKYLNQLLQNEL